MKKCFLFLLALSLSIAGFSQSEKNLSLISQMTFNADLNDVWAYVDGNGHEYALVGRVDGVSIVDITTDPANPTELFSIPGRNSTWRDLKTHGTYAYVSNETGDGTLIIDLSGLPGNINFKDTIMSGIETTHNVWISDGTLYLVGTNNFNGGMVMFDLNSDPWHPQFVGAYTDRYVHDVYVRGNTAYLAEINDGFLTIADVTNKSAVAVQGFRDYENSFTHNTWLNDAGTVCFTTDELSKAYINAWDITDPSDIKLLDRIRSIQGEGETTPHNGHVLNDYLVTSYYKDGVTITDVSRPGNMVEVGNYDTNTLTGGGTDGCWGAYPFLPSGLVLATDMNEGLFVLSPTYVRGCYLEGNITDATNSNSLMDVSITLVGPAANELSNNDGDYAMGTVDAGSYVVEYDKFGYVSETRTVSLVNGQVTMQDVQMTPASQIVFDFNVIDSRTNLPIVDADILAIAPRNAASFPYKTDVNGQAKDNSFISGKYDFVAGKWGYITDQVTTTADANNLSVTIKLKEGYYDDFIFENTWRVVGNASAGVWERGEPIGTDLFGNEANPENDLSDDFGFDCYVTGNGGGSAGDDDVDNGTTVLISPVMDLTKYANPTLSFHWWLLNLRLGGGGGQQGDDFLKVEISDGTNTIEVANYENTWRNFWNNSTPLSIKDHFPVLTSNMTVIFTTEDTDTPNLVEAAIDKFQVLDGFPTAIDAVANGQASVSFYPNPTEGIVNLRYDINSVSIGDELVIELFDLTGKMLSAASLDPLSNTQQLELPFSKGVYIAVIRLNGQAVSYNRIIRK